MSRKRAIYLCSIIFFLVSLIYPHDGKWFAGFWIFILSIVGSIIFIPKISVGNIDNAIAILPIVNVFYIFAAIRFKESRVEKYLTWQVLLYISTILGCIVGAILTLKVSFIHGVLNAFYIWLLALILLCIANLLSIVTPNK